MFNNERLDMMVSNLSESIIIFAETVAMGREDEVYIQHQLLTRACGEILSYCLLIAGENHIDEVSQFLIKEIIAHAKMLLHDNTETENDS